MSKKFKDGDLSYYLTLFKLEGHQTWRAALKSHPTSFDKEVKNWPKTSPKVTEKQTLRIDRITGLFADSK